MSQIELAPNHKRNLTLTNPLVLSAGFAINIPVGALVTLPLTLHARSGAPQPHVVEISGGCLMRTGAANPGLERVLHDHRRGWSQGRVPIIVALAAQGVADWPAMAARLERVENVGGVELQLNPALDAVDAIRTTRSATELPILAKLDLDNAIEIAADCVAAGANALVIGRAPRGMMIVNGNPWYGRLFGPMTKPLALGVLAQVAAMKLDVPLVACGGVRSEKDAHEFLSAGACAVEIDSAAWVDLALVERIAAEWDTSEHQ